MRENQPVVSPEKGRYLNNICLLPVVFPNLRDSAYSLEVFTPSPFHPFHYLFVFKITHFRKKIQPLGKDHILKFTL